MKKLILPILVGAIAVCAPAFTYAEDCIRSERLWVHFSYYPSGHMFYLNEESCAAFHEEAEARYAEP